MRVQLGLPKLKPLGIPNGNGCNLVVATNASLRDPTFFDSQQLSSTNPPTSPASVQINHSSESIFHGNNSIQRTGWNVMVGIFPSKKLKFFTILFSDPEINEILGIPGIVTAPPQTPRWTFTPRKVTPQHR